MMEFTFETEYNAKSLAIMAKALRKTIRKQHSRRSHIFGWIITVLALLLIVKNLAFDMRTVVTSAAVLAIVTALLFEDRLNGYFAKRRMLAGTEKAVTVFSENGFSSTTNIGKSEWGYDAIVTVAETTNFFIFIFSASHAQLYDKRLLTGGTAEDFRHFIESATGKPVQHIR